MAFSWESKSASKIEATKCCVWFKKNKNIFHKWHFIGSDFIVYYIAKYSKWSIHKISKIGSIHWSTWSYKNQYVPRFDFELFGYTLDRYLELAASDKQSKADLAWCLHWPHSPLGYAWQTIFTLNTYLGICKITQLFYLP